jgi:D-alanyl-D-alanine carboxypeptidase/D-alanyl-D-alanine-endopeptidase (penicillin-binding protein 4)
LLIAIVAATVVLVRSIAGYGGQGPQEGVGVVEPSGAVLAAAGVEAFVAPVADAFSSGVGESAVRELEGRVEALVMEAVHDAGRRSQGKVTPQNTAVAVHVFDPGADSELVRRMADSSLRPASNMKLLTSAAALVALGPDWHFETGFYAAGPIEAGVLKGDLVVAAGGDPLFDPAAQGRVEHLFAPVVRELRAAGVREVAGDLVLDQGSYLDPGPGPGWPSSSQHWQEYCALAAGLSANAGCLTALVEPRAVGGAAFSEIRPRASRLKRKGSVRTVKASARLDIAVGANNAGATLRGEIPTSVPSWTSRFAHPDPVGLFGNSARAALEQGGIRLHGGVRRQRGAVRGMRLANLRTPLIDVLAPINTDSNNAVADQLFFALGDARSGSGTRAGGARAVSEALEELGVSSKGLVQVDGSGLSRDDRVTARQLTRLLAAALDLQPRQRKAFLDSLAVSGSSGSLENRMTGDHLRGRVMAKTGWISGTGALSGYVRTTGGELLCFSVLVEYPKVSGLNKHCWKPMQDRICEELVAWRRDQGGVR